jgi:hypothetical protein
LPVLLKGATTQEDGQQNGHPGGRDEAKAGVNTLLEAEVFLQFSVSNLLLSRVDRTPYHQTKIKGTHGSFDDPKQEGISGPAGKLCLRAVDPVSFVRLSVTHC